MCWSKIKPETSKLQNDDLSSVVVALWISYHVLTILLGNIKYELTSMSVFTQALIDILVNYYWNRLIAPHAINIPPSGENIPRQN